MTGRTKRISPYDGPFSESRSFGNETTTAKLQMRESPMLSNQ
jgi:hypothetical protein